MIYAFVMAAKDDDVFVHRHGIGHFLVQCFSVRSHINYFVVMALAFQMRNAIVYRLDHHDHTGTAAKLIIIYTSLLVGGVISQIVKMHFYQSFFDSAFHNGSLKRASQ